MTLEQLINEAGFLLRSLSLHSNGEWLARSGASAPKPKKLYSGKTPQEALAKLINDQQT